MNQNQLQIPQSVLEQELNNKVNSEDLKSFEPNITIYVYKIVNLALSELKNYTIQKNSINIFRYEPLYFTTVIEDKKTVQCNWFKAYQSTKNTNMVPVEKGDDNITFQNVSKTSIIVNNSIFLNSFSSQDLIIYSLNKPLEDFRIEDSLDNFLPSEITFIGNVYKKEIANINLLSINGLKIAKNSRIIFISNKNEFKDYSLNGLIITKPIETIIDTVQVIGYRNGLAEEYEVPLSIDENVYTYCKFQVADENEIISLYFDWLDAYKVLTFFYFKDDTENINLFKTIFSETFTDNFQKAFLFTLIFSFIYNSGFSEMSDNFNRTKQITTIDDYFYTLLTSAKNDVASVCDNWISNVIFKIPYTKETNDFMKYRSVIGMLNEYLYSNMSFGGGFNETQRLFLPYYFTLTITIDREFINNTVIFNTEKTGIQLDFNLTDINVSLRSNFFNFVKDKDLNENILIPLWNDISDKPLVGFVPNNLRQGWNEVKGKYLTIDTELKKQNYLNNVNDEKKLDIELLKYLGIIFFESKDDLRRFWIFRNDNETDRRILSFKKDFGEDKSKDKPFLIEETKIILNNEEITNYKTIDIFGEPQFVPEYKEYTMDGWIYFVRDLLLDARNNKGIPYFFTDHDNIFYKDTNFLKGDILNQYGYIYKIDNNKNKAYVLTLDVVEMRDTSSGLPLSYWGFSQLDPRFWEVKGSNFWKSKISDKQGNEKNWLDPNNPFLWAIAFNTNYIWWKEGKLYETNVIIVSKELNIFREGEKYKIYADPSLHYENDRLVPAALLPILYTEWSADITFKTSGTDINDFYVIYNRQNWLSYFFQLNPSYITGKKTMDFKILFKESKNFQLNKIKTIRIRGIWGGDFGLKIRYLDSKGTEFIEDLKNDRIKDSFVLFDNNNERITETNINFV